MSELDTVEFDELVKRMACHDAAQREAQAKELYRILSAAVQGLYIAVDKSVADDVFEKWIAYKDSVREMIRQLQEQLKTARYEAVRRFVHGEDKMCLVCAAKEPCKLKDDPSSPCTFEPTPMELLAKVRQQAEQIQTLEERLSKWRTRQEGQNDQ